MGMGTMESIRKLIRDVPDFPKPGILFRDITPLLEDPSGLRKVTELFAERYQSQRVTKIAAIESRGFVFGGALACALGCGLVLVRKPGKLPRPTYRATYALEYGEDSVTIHQDAISRGDRILILDDVIATGGTAMATVELVRRAGGTVVEVAALIELSALAGRAKLAGVPVHALLTY